MKKIINILLIVFVFFAFISCNNNKKQVPEIDIYATTEEPTTKTLEPQKSKIVVFADNSLEELMNNIKVKYEAKYSNTDVIYQFDTSESLKDQIVNIADCDLFISSDPSILDKIDITKGNDVNAEMFDFIEPDSRVVVFKGNKELDKALTYEACIIRIGANIEEAKRFMNFLINYDT